MTQPMPDSTAKTGVPIRQLKAFAGVSAEALSKLETRAELFKFRVGQPLCDLGGLPKRAYWILEGSCRLLGNERDRLTTLAKMGPGSSVGLASMLRANPCEMVTAASDVVALAVPDDLIIELYSAEESFKAWCNQTLWPAEIEFILRRIIKNDPQSSNSILEKLANLVRAATLITPSKSEDIKLPSNQSGETRYFVGSANSDLEIGSDFSADQPLPETRPPFALRIISLPSALLREKGENTGNLANKKLETTGIAKAAPDLVDRGDQDFGQINPLREFKLIEAKGEIEEILACFQMLAKQLSLPFRRDSIDKILRDSIKRGQQPTLQLCGQLGASLGLHVAAAKTTASMGVRLQVPSLLSWNGSFALAIRSDVSGLTLASPNQGYVTIPADQLESEFPEGMEVLIMDRAINTPEERFGLTWFLPALRRHRAVLIQVLVASAVVQLFGLANPLLIQVIIDKVISQRSLDTLQVLGIGLVIVTVLEGVLGSLRTFLFTETTNRIDQRLGAEVIDHLLRLPLNYFDRRPVGELGTRVAELEKIRNFLTGTALTTILDAAFSVIYIVVMAFYSWLLTIVALAVIPIQVGITLVGAPLFRRQFRQSAEENAKTQSHLVEVLTGIQTVKAQNVEMVSRWKWQDLYSKYINKQFEKTITGTSVSQTSQVLQKLSQLLVLWIGAALVLNGELTLGQLIAFRIISGYVTQPLLRLSSIWQNIQELKVSFERLADVIDTPIESNMADQAKIPLPPIEGRINFENVSFQFKPDQSPVLKDINLSFEAGTFVGIVGQSGSGKSTLMKLLPRLYSPQQGRVKIDGYDIDKTELYSLRRQIGVVPQDPLLFSGTIAENIALTNPDADSKDIVAAAQLACAHDFIMELPLGYSTPVGERGGSLSGGQRQRIAIARTLLSNPKLLVMDEATSALDYETERRVCNNLLDNLKDCTVFFITHRLSTIRRADRVIMLHQGAIAEEGDHNSLMAKNGRYYALYKQQEVN